MSKPTQLTATETISRLCLQALLACINLDKSSKKISRMGKMVSLMRLRNNKLSARSKIFLTILCLRSKNSSVWISFNPKYAKAIDTSTKNCSLWNKTAAHTRVTEITLQFTPHNLLMLFVTQLKWVKHNQLCSLKWNGFLRPLVSVALPKPLWESKTARTHQRGHL